jgi:hypothetical protein
MTGSTASSALVLLRAARPAAASSSAGPHAAKVRRYRLARARLNASLQDEPRRVSSGTCSVPRTPGPRS